MHYTTSCKQSSVPEDGRNYCPKHIELIEITNKLLLFNLVGCLYYCSTDWKFHDEVMTGGLQTAWYPLVDDFL